jgi:hypothetical protein
MTDETVGTVLPMGARMLTMAAWAERHGFAERSVQRWIRAGELPAAVMVGNRWEIPEHAQRVEQVTMRAAGQVLAERAGAELTTTEDDEPPVPVSVREALDTLPGYLPLDVAARLLGIPRHQVRDHADVFEAVPFGRRGSLVVPAAVVRRIGGI